MMNHLMIEYVVCPEGSQSLVIGQRAYQKNRAEDWEPIVPDVLSNTATTRNERIQGILIGGVTQ